MQFVEQIQIYEDFELPDTFIACLAFHVTFVTCHIDCAKNIELWVFSWLWQLVGVLFLKSAFHSYKCELNDEFFWN